MMSNRTIPPIPNCAGTPYVGRKSRPNWESGNPKAVNDAAAYIAPDAPREGKMSITGRIKKLPLEAVWAAVAAAADADAVAAAPLDEAESCDTTRGNIILVEAM
jgi:hypothetical protein